MNAVCRVCPAEAASGREEEGDGPLSKRRKLDPAEVEMILNAKSSHEWAAREVSQMIVVTLNVTVT